MNLLSGLKNRSPSPTDKSMSPKPRNIDSGAVRSSTAKTPKTLGPRNT